MKSLEEIEQRTNSDWKHLRHARDKSAIETASLNTLLDEFSTSDSCIVVVGSLARKEFTSGSDIDWTLLLDGISRPQDEHVARRVRQVLENAGKKQPGREGTFGTFVSSHDLIHRIGGESDTNANTTRRILLLLESLAIGSGEARDRVLNNILHRYLDEDRGLWYSANPSKVPRFLFNDVARYWRTMAVDFAYKQRTRPDGGFLLRNIKLRMSRKLLFLSGMLTCFTCHTRFKKADERKVYYAAKPVEAVIKNLRDVLNNTPLEILALSLLPYLEQFECPIKELFTAYDKFIGMLEDDKTRECLDTLAVEQIDENEVARQAREISHSFRDAISNLFLTQDTELGRLTLEYGVF